jgi:dipeptidyl aminopeptidase/acylaminoacyl peptidase
LPFHYYHRYCKLISSEVVIKGIKLMRFIARFVLFLSFIQLAYSQTELVPVSAYGKLENKSMYTVSPTGEYVAYRDTKDGRDLVVVISTKDFSFVNAVNVAEVNPNRLYFVDDDKLIMVVSQNNRIYGYKGRHEIRHAFAYNVTTKKLHQMLTPGSGDITTAQNNLGRIVGISHDKTMAYMPAYDEELRLNLYRVSLEKKKRERVHERGTKDTIDFFMGDNDKVIARDRCIKSRKLHIVESFFSGKWKVVFEQKTDFMVTGFNGVTPDKKSLVMSVNRKNGLRAYYSLSLEDGSVTEPLFSREDKGVERTITDVNRIVYGVEYSGFKPSYEFFDEKLNARMRGIDKALLKYTNRIVDYTENWDSIIFYSEGVNNPGSFLMYKQGGLTLLAKSRPDLSITSVANLEEYAYEARDGLVIPTLLTYPRGKERTNLPAIMMPHGGPASYDKIRFDYLAQYFANRGYLVIQPQFRGSKGFGAQHTIIGRGEWGRKMQDDLTDGVTHLAEAGVIDSSKVCIVGASYGGYAALAGAVFTPDLYKCVIAINGVSDLNDMMSSERAKYGNDHWVITYWDKIISGGEFDKEHLKQISPINHVEKVKAPILLIHGEYDKVVPWSQSDDMFDELEDADKDATFIKLKKGDHYLSSAINRMKAMEAIDAFLKKHM